MSCAGVAGEAAAAAAPIVGGAAGAGAPRTPKDEDTAGEGAAYFQSLDATAGQVKAVTVLYFFFGFLWTSQVLLALNGMIIAGAVCSWYWRVSINLPITKAATRTLLSHIGTVCFGSFIIALVKFVRYAARAILAQFGAIRRAIL